MIQGHSRSGEGKQITKKVVKFRAVNKLVAHGAELVSVAVQHCARRSITLRDDDKRVSLVMAILPCCVEVNGENATDISPRSQNYTTDVFG